MAKEKKTRTPTQKKRAYQRGKWIAFGGEFVSVIMPFVIIGAVKYQDYFVEYSGTKMSIAAALSFALMGIATWLVASNKFKNSFIVLIIGWLAVDFIFFMMGKIINDISWIMLFGAIGILGAYGLDILSKQLDKKAQEIQKGIDAAKEEQVKEEYKEEIKEEKQAKKNKVVW